MHKILGLFVFITLAGCSGLKNLPKYQLSNDYYSFHQPGQPSVQVFVTHKDDSIQITKLDQTLEIVSGQDEYFIKRSFMLMP